MPNFHTCDRNPGEPRTAAGSGGLAATGPGPSAPGGRPGSPWTPPERREPGFVGWPGAGAGSAVADLPAEPDLVAGEWRQAAGPDRPDQIRGRSGRWDDLGALPRPDRPEIPESGWRAALFHATGGALRIRPSASERIRHDLIRRSRSPVTGGHYRIVALSLKGGVGKTTCVAGLGATLAALRGDRVIAIDANPDRGTLSDKVRLETSATVRDLVSERGQIRRYADVRAYTSQAASGLEILASDLDPAMSDAFGAEDYSIASEIAADFYSICLTDCGTGLLHSAMGEILRVADQIIVATTQAVDSARSAAATLDWLEAQGYADLAAEAIVVLSAVRPRDRGTVSLELLEEYFGGRVRAVARIPYDVVLDEGAEVELDRLDRATLSAFLELAALVADGFAADVTG